MRDQTRNVRSRRAGPTETAERPYSAADQFRRRTDRLANRAEVAEYLGVSPRTLDDWAYRQSGPTFIKVAGSARYRWSDVEQWLDAQQTGGVPA